MSAHSRKKCLSWLWHGAGFVVGGEVLQVSSFLLPIETHDLGDSAAPGGSCHSPFYGS